MTIPRKPKQKYISARATPESPEKIYGELLPQSCS
jgi:hypothetical protein